MLDALQYSQKTELSQEQIASINYQSLESILWSEEIRNLVCQARTVMGKSRNIPTEDIEEAEKLYFQALEIAESDLLAKVFLLVELNINLYYPSRDSMKMLANVNWILELLDNMEGKSVIKFILRIFAFTQSGIANELNGNQNAFQKACIDVLEIVNQIPGINPHFASATFNNLVIVQGYNAIKNEFLIEQLMSTRPITKERTGKLKRYNALRNVVRYYNAIGEYNRVIALINEILSDEDSGLADVALWTVKIAKAIAYTGKAKQDSQYMEEAKKLLYEVINSFQDSSDKETQSYRGRAFHALATISLPDEALRICAQNCKLYTELGDKYHLGKAHLLEAQIRVRRGQGDDRKLAETSYLEAFKCFQGRLPVESKYFKEVLVGFAEILEFDELSALSCLSEMAEMEKRKILANIEEECVKFSLAGNEEKNVYAKIAKMGENHWGINYIEVRVDGSLLYSSGNLAPAIKEQLSQVQEERSGRFGYKVKHNFWEQEPRDNSVGTAMSLSTKENGKNVEVLVAKRNGESIDDEDYLFMLRKYLKAIAMMASKEQEKLKEVAIVTRNLVEVSVMGVNIEQILSIIADKRTPEAKYYNALRALSRKVGDRPAQRILLNKAYLTLRSGMPQEADNLHQAACILGSEDPKDVTAYTNMKLRFYNTIPYDFLTGIMNSADLEGYGNLVRPSASRIGLFGGGSMREIYVLEQLMSIRERVYGVLDREKSALFAGINQMLPPDQKDPQGLVDCYGREIGMEIHNRIKDQSSPELLKRVLPIQADFLEETSAEIRAKIKEEIRRNRHIIMELFANLNDFDTIIFGMRTLMYVYGWQDLHTVLFCVNEMLAEDGDVIINLIDLETKFDEHGRPNFYGCHEKVYEDKAKKEGRLFAKGTFRDKITGTRRSPPLNQLYHIARNTGFDFGEKDIIKVNLPFKINPDASEDTEEDKVTGLKYLEEAGILQTLLNGDQEMQDLAQLAVEKGTFRRDIYVKLHLRN